MQEGWRLSVVPSVKKEARQILNWRAFPYSAIILLL